MKARLGAHLLLGGLALLVLAVPAVARAGTASLRWLDVCEPPRESDLMVVLAGGARERLQTARDLYAAGAAPAIMVTSPEGFPDAPMKWLASNGVPPPVLVAPLRPSSSTLDDALSIGQIIRRKGITSVLVVTSPYHCRRTRLILNRILSGLSSRVTVTASTTLYMDPDRWWESRAGWATIPAEYLKLIWAWMTVPRPFGVEAARLGIEGGSP